MRALLLILWGCPRAPAPAPDDCGEHTWRSTGEPVLLTWCVPCHSSTLPAELRQGAPLGIDFDTYEATLPWASRIAARTTGEAPTMPPGGGVPQAERDALQQWIACGMPGQTEAPADPCLSPEALPGDLHSADSPCEPGLGLAVSGNLWVEELADLSCVCSVAGDLQLLADAQLPRLTRVGGALVAEGGAFEARLPRLAESGPLTLRGATALEIPELATVHGPVEVSGLQGAVVPLGGLRRVEGDLVVEDAQASVLDLSRLEEVQGELILRGMPQVVELRGALGLTSVGGSLVLEDLPALSSLDTFGALVTVGGSIVLRRVGTPSFEAFDRIEAVPGDVWLEDVRGVVDTIAFPDLVTVGGSLVLLHSEALSSWGGLPWLVSVGGDLHFEGNGALAALPPWSGLVSVGGDLRFVDNAKLPTSDVRRLAKQATVLGEVVIEGNAP